MNGGVGEGKLAVDRGRTEESLWSFRVGIAVSSLEMYDWTEELEDEVDTEPAAVWLTGRELIPATAPFAGS